MKLLLEKFKPKVLLLTETHITDEIGDHEINISGYELVRCISDSRHTGGVIAYVINTTAYSIRCNT